MGWCDPGVARDLDQSGDRRTRRADRPVEWQGYRADRDPRRWYADPLDLQRGHTGLVPLDRRSAESGWPDLEARRRVSRQAGRLCKGMTMRNDRALREHVLNLLKGDGA